jgi:hypothetical protein
MSASPAPEPWRLCSRHREPEQRVRAQEELSHLAQERERRQQPRRDVLEEVELRVMHARSTGERVSQLSRLRHRDHLIVAVVGEGDQLCAQAAEMRERRERGEPLLRSRR